MFMAAQTFKDVMDNIVIFGLGLSGTVYLIKGALVFRRPKKSRRNIKLTVRPDGNKAA